MSSTNGTTGAESIWDQRYKDGDLACTQQNVEADPIDYTQHPFLYKYSTAKKITGSLDGDPLLMIAEKFLTPPAKRMLAIGSGLAFKEELLVRNGYVEHLVAFESSVTAVESARERFKKAGLDNKIEIHAGDVVNAGLEKESFDAIFIQAAIHHFYNIEEMYELFHYVLKPGGQILYDEYVGPDMHMYESEVYELMDEVNDCLAPVYQWDTLRSETRVEVPQATLEWMLEMDPSEGVHATQILPLTYKYFDIEYRKDYGGTFMRPFFVGILPNFDFEDVKDQTVARLIILMEDLLIQTGKIPSYHSWVVARKREEPRSDWTEEDVDRINYADWSGWGKYGLQASTPTSSNYKTADYSDENWKNGVGILGKNAVFFLSASRKACKDFTVGRIVTFIDGSSREIESVQKQDQSLVITLSGKKLKPEIAGFPNVIKLSDHG